MSLLSVAKLSSFNSPCFKFLKKESILIKLSEVKTAVNILLWLLKIISVSRNVGYYAVPVTLLIYNAEKKDCKVNKRFFLAWDLIARI